MMSVELFSLLKFGKHPHNIIFLYFCLLNYIKCDKLGHFIKKFKYFSSNNGIYKVVSKLNFAS